MREGERKIKRGRMEECEIESGRMCGREKRMGEGETKNERESD